MGQTLTNGIYLPDEGERNSYSGLEVNWRTLDALILTVNGKAAPNIANTWTAAQTFTAGITGDLTGNVTGNVTGDLTGTAAKAIADEDGTSIKTGYVNVAGNQTVTGDKSFTGSNTFNNILPNATNTYALGSFSYQWYSVYAQNYYYNGTAWGLDKANVWTRDNTFSSTLKQVNSTVTKGTNPQSDITAFSLYWGGTGVSSLNNALYAQRLSLSADGSTTVFFYVLENAFGGTHTSLSLKYNPNDTVNKRYAYLRGDFRPYADNSYNLGTSTNKWKTLNGINPGALSLPSSSYVEIDTTNWDLTGADNSYAPPADGYLFCASNTCTDVKVYDFTTQLGATSHSATSRANYVYLPVRKNDNCIVGFVGTSPVARFYPALGNVWEST